jgi:hypothetical protein
MPDLRKSVPLLFVLTLLGLGGSLRAEVHLPGVGGRVVGEANPLSSAHIYAIQLTDLSWRKVLTDGRGNFLFKDLPVGLYKIIAHKAGFLPAMMMVTRTTAQAYQNLEFQLAERQAGHGRDEDDFWAIRARVPGDVLRDIETSEAIASGRISPTPELPPFRLSPSGSGNRIAAATVAGALASNFQADVQALTGVDSIANSGGQMSGAGLGLKGQLGQTQVDVQGRFLNLNSDTFQPGGGASLGAGQTSSVALDLAHGPGSRLSIVSLNNRMSSRSESGIGSPVDFEHYGFNYSQAVGENGRSEFAGHYTTENNFHRQSAIDPLDIPGQSRSLAIEASYIETFSDRNTLQAGLRYRDRQFGLGDTERLNGPGGPGGPGGPSSKLYDLQQDLASVDLFTRGGLRVEPAVLLEYGLYSTLSDGSLALTPQGGVVLQLESDWQLETSAAHRVYRDQPAAPDFLPTLFQQRDLCEQGSESCYQVNLSRKVGDDSLTFGAVQHKVGDTLRLYFSEDFFDRAESLYLVRGDSLPELRVGFKHKFAKSVVTKLDSSLASGGGGVFVAADGLPYENRVRYLVTSLDTKFLGSQTGVFVAFHRLEQGLAPVGDATGRTASQVSLQRLQVMVNQNLNFLMNLASDWAVQLNMELSRGFDPSTGLASEGTRRRILGGIAVKF